MAAGSAIARLREPTVSAKQNHHGLQLKQSLSVRTGSWQHAQCVRWVEVDRAWFRGPKVYDMMTD
jgi:hypothetical protein